MTAADSYAELTRRSKELAVLQSCAAVLGWDQQTYLPAAGTGLRAEQLAFLAADAHRRATDPAVGDLLAAVEGSDVTSDPAAVEAANVREWRRAYDRAVKVPARLVEELARATAVAHPAWQTARADDDFPAFRPHLETILNLKREEADAVGPPGRRYDALLDEYEPGATAADLTRLFAELTAELAPLVRGIADRGRRPRADFLRRDYPVDRQRWFAEAAAAAVGFDFAAGRLDTSTHPFCSGVGPGDCRLTTRFDPKFFPTGFFGVLHEAGHGMYEQGLPADRFGTPCGTYCSLGVHESQSRFWENQVGRSRPFWDGFFPRLAQAFPGTLRDVRADEFYAAVNDVRPSLIRVEADEATYNLHVALRFELEQQLLSGNLPVSDLPAAWNDRCEQLLGLRPVTDRDGCLQDIHWSFGGFGYFPTYTLGNLYAAELSAAAAAALGPAAADPRDFGPLRGWLAAAVYRHGRRLPAGDLVAAAVGHRPTAGPFLRYLRDKLAPLYAVC